MRKLISLLFIILIVFNMSSCGDGESSCSELINSGTLPFQSELTAYESASAQFGAEPNMENCEKLVSTGRVYIDAMKEYQACLNPEDRIQYAESLERAEDSIDSINCN